MTISDEAVCRRMDKLLTRITFLEDVIAQMEEEL